MKNLYNQLRSSGSQPMKFTASQYTILRSLSDTLRTRCWSRLRMRRWSWLSNVPVNEAVWVNHDKLQEDKLLMYRTTLSPKRVTENLSSGKTVDTYCFVKKGTAEGLLSHPNGVWPNIDFPMEVRKNGTPPLLDTLLIGGRMREAWMLLPTESPLPPPTWGQPAMSSESCL